MAIATNDQGQALRLDESGQWVPTKLATNPQTHERLALDGDKWVSVPAATKPPDKGPSTLMDSIKGFGSGVLQNLNTFLGDSGPLQTGENDPQFSQSHLPAAEVMSSVPGSTYKPQTTAGQYAQTAGQFLPSALAPGGMAARAARVLLPAAASESLGQLTKGSSSEPYARLAGGLLGGGVEGLGEAAAPTAGRLANKGYNQLTGNSLFDPQKTAMLLLSKSIAKDGGLPKTTDNLAAWGQSGASAPSLLDVTGNNTARLVRSAAAPNDGEAQVFARNYADRVKANFQDNVLDRASELTPLDQRTAAQASDNLQTAQSNVANEQYREPYSQPAAVTKEMVSALQGPEGRAAIGRALTAASANRNVQQMGELRDLLAVAQRQSGGTDPITGKFMSLDDALGNVSAGSLDRVRIAMRERGNALYQSGARDIASGYKARVGDIDTALDQTPNLQEARGVYRGFQADRNAVDLGGQGLRLPSADYSAQMADLSKLSHDAIPNAQIGYRQAIQDAVEAPAAGATGVVNRLQSSTRQTNNLATTFGQEAAGRFQTAIGNESNRLQNARFIDPNTGSQTALRTADQNLLDSIPLSKWGVMKAIIGKFWSGATLTDAERAELVKLGTSEATLKQTLGSLPPTPNRTLPRSTLLLTPGILSSMQNRANP